MKRIVREKLFPARRTVALEARNAQPDVYFVIDANNLIGKEKECDMARPSSRHKNNFDPDAVARAWWRWRRTSAPAPEAVIWVKWRRRCVFSTAAMETFATAAGFNFQRRQKRT